MRLNNPLYPVGEHFAKENQASLRYAALNGREQGNKEEVEARIRSAQLIVPHENITSHGCFAYWSNGSVYLAAYTCPRPCGTRHGLSIGGKHRAFRMITGEERTRIILNHPPKEEIEIEEQVRKLFPKAPTHFMSIPSGQQIIDALWKGCHEINQERVHGLLLSLYGNHQL